MPNIILDRDGVINFDSDYYIKSPAEFHFIPGSLEAIVALTQADYQIFVATNQSGVARGLYTLDTMHEINKKLLTHVQAAGGDIKEIFYCEHHPKDKCIDRKPQPGMFYKIKEKYGVDFASTYYIGDTHTDMEVALTVGCRPILVLTGNGQKVLKNYPQYSTIQRCADLLTAVNFILAKE